MKMLRSRMSRRQFLSSSAILAVSATMPGCKTRELGHPREPIIDIHQHVDYHERSDASLLMHQRAMGITTTILLPAGRPINSASTHEGVSNGLQAKCAGNQACLEFARAHPREFRFAANEVPDLPEATAEIEKYLKLGAIGIAEQKFGVECDSPEMQRLYALAADYRVPILMHWQVKMYNYGFERFYKMLEKFPRTTFIGHAQTWWANIDKNYRDDPAKLYPKGPVAAGGLTDRYLADYPNMFGDLSAGSGLNAFNRDEEHMRGFIQRHQDKLIYGSDCDDLLGAGEKCQGAQTIAAVRRLAGSKRLERKLLYENARRVFKI
jgi:predicted TIM-barrel fold metal-dependent hydrolase